MTPAGLELNPHGLRVGTCNYILPGLELNPRCLIVGTCSYILQGQVLAGLTINSHRVIF